MQLDHLHEGDIDQQLLVRIAGEVQPLVVSVTLQPPSIRHQNFAQNKDFAKKNERSGTTQPSTKP
jgi:hypothetical protein